MGSRLDALKSKILDKLFALVDEAGLAEIPALASVYEALSEAEPVLVEEPVAEEAEPEAEADVEKVEE